jgi:hypothetical protein
VFATATVALTVLGTVTGTVIVQGLPFQAEAHTANAPAWSVGVAYFSLPGSWASISGFIQPSTNFIYLQGVPAGGATAPVFLTPANLANTSTFILTASYLAQD